MGEGGVGGEVQQHAIWKPGLLLLLWRREVMASAGGGLSGGH